VPEALHARLAEGGAVTFASAAALTLGLVTIPVYEVYKVGEQPRWLEGLDVLGRATGLRAAVVPHWNNAEGGTHDTRFCWQGERRLRMLEDLLPEDAFVLGVDEHTGLVIDLDSGACEVVGRGTVVVRVHGDEWVVPTGQTISVDQIADHGRSAASPHPTGASLGTRTSESSVAVATAGSTPATATSDASVPASEVVTTLAPAAAVAPGPHPAHAIDVPASATRDDARGRAFDAALDSGDTATALALVLDAMTGATTDDSGHVRSMLARATAALGDPVDVTGTLRPLVDLLLRLRDQARADKRWADSDAIRDGLAAAGVEVRDTPDGTTWEARP
jgi:hypothetical protein